MKEIILTQNQVALVDDEDYEFLNQWKWQAWVTESGNWYASRGQIKGEYTRYINRKTIKMHRLIMNAPDGVEVDHWDNNSLNNQKSNLRLSTKNQNQHNQRIRSSLNKASQFKGVNLLKCKKKNKIYEYWVSYLRLNNKPIYLGSFKSEIEAAKAYDSKATELFGEFAKLNFPEGD